MPYPTISDKLAKKRHMYICLNRKNHDLMLAKVQTDKVLNRIHMVEYIAEPDDPSRNPFRRDSLIDCDKRFELKDCEVSSEAYPKDARKDVCDSLFQEVVDKIKDKPINNIDVDIASSVDERITRASASISVT